MPREQSRQRVNHAEFQRYETCASPDRNPIKLRTDGFYMVQGKNERREPKVFRFYEDGEILGFLAKDYVGESLPCECFARGTPRPENEPVDAVVRGRYCIDGAHVSFSLTGTYGGQREPVMYRGTVAADGTSLRGTSDYALELVLKFKTFEQAGCSMLSSSRRSGDRHWPVADGRPDRNETLRTSPRPAPTRTRRHEWFSLCGDARGTPPPRTRDVIL